MRLYGIPISQADPPATLGDERKARKLGQWMWEQSFARLVVDSLVDVRGDRKLVEEEIGDVLRMWRIVVQESGAAVILISHPTKGSDDLYGSQYIKAKLDHLYHVTRKGDMAIIESQKQRSFGVTGKLQAHWSWYHFDGTRTLETARSWGDNSQRGHSETVTTQEECLQALMSCQGHALTPDEVMEIANSRREDRELKPLSSGAVRNALNRLAENVRNVGKLDDPVRYHFGESIT